jgi:alanine racemase
VYTPAGAPLSPQDPASVRIEDELRSAGLPALPRTAWLEVNLSALERNARTLRRLLDSGTRLGIVVKDNGYGHGAAMAARAAVAGGAEYLFVATVDEAYELRDAGIGAPIVLLAPVPGWTVADVVARDLQATVTDPATTMETLDAWRRSSDRTPGRDLALHLEIDTGMTRGGAAPDAAEGLACMIRGERRVQLRGLWTHLASAEDASLAAAQVRQFEVVRAAVAGTGSPETLVHVASSGGLLCGTCPHYDLVRIGLAYYGTPPREVLESEHGRVAAAGLEGALRLIARAVRIADVAAGSAVGYGGEWRAERPSTIATLPVGYADAYQRASWPGAAVLLRGRRVPIVGRVSSDAIGVDVTDLAPVGMDEEFVLLGAQGDDAVTPAELARVRRTNEWEILIALPGRLPRVFRDEGGIVGVSYQPASLTLKQDPP